MPSTVRVRRDDLRVLFERAFAGKIPIDLTAEELGLVERIRPLVFEPPKPRYESLKPEALRPGDEVEFYIIATNDGWEWCPATILSIAPLTVRWWDGTERSWRPQARIPEIRRRDALAEKRTLAD